LLPEYNPPRGCLPVHIYQAIGAYVHTHISCEIARQQHDKGDQEKDNHRVSGHLQESRRKGEILVQETSQGHQGHYKPEYGENTAQAICKICSMQF